MENLTLFGLPFIEWVGYLASTLVLISLSLSSIVKLRIFNMIGASIFAFYGYYIGALPVGIMNSVIVLANVYYLRQIYFRRDDFDMVITDYKNPYLVNFNEYFKKDIAKFYPEFSGLTSTMKVFLVLRNMQVAGYIAVDKTGYGAEIVIDYVTPEYRDYKAGLHVYKRLKEMLKKEEVSQILCKSDVKAQQKYLEKMGFVADKNSDVYRLSIR